MPPAFQREGIDAAQLIRMRHPGTGVVVLSQYDDPDYAVALLSEGASGYAYLLKDRIAEGDQLADAIRMVAQGGSMLDPVIVNALVGPCRSTVICRRWTRRSSRSFVGGGAAQPRVDERSEPSFDLDGAGELLGVASTVELLGMLLAVGRRVADEIRRRTVRQRAP